MSYDWSGEAEGQGAADKIPHGVCRVEGQRVITGSAKGDFRSKAGDPQVMLIVADDNGAEASIMFTLSDKASWVLARWLSRCGVDLKAMQAEGIEPKHFANQGIAEKYLCGVGTWARIEPDRDPKYTRVTPLTEEEAVGKAVATPATKAPEKGDSLNLDDIPF